MNKREVKRSLEVALAHLDKVIPCKCEDSAYYLGLAKDRINDVLAMCETKKNK